MGFSGAILNSMMSFYDNNFFIQHPELNRYVGEIDYGKHNWLNFSLTEEDKLDLFIRGAKAASVFLKRFKWDYQKDRNFLSRILQFSQT
jgi:NTE family protein